MIFATEFSTAHHHAARPCTSKYTVSLACAPPTMEHKVHTGEANESEFFTQTTMGAMRTIENESQPRRPNPLFV